VQQAERRREKKLPFSSPFIFVRAASICEAINLVARGTGAAGSRISSLNDAILTLGFLHLIRL
jgi:hypothetical protein